MKCRINPDLKAAPRYNERGKPFMSVRWPRCTLTARLHACLAELSLSGYLKQSERRVIEARLKAFGHDKELALDEVYTGFKVKK